MKYRITLVTLALLLPLSGCVVYTGPQGSPHPQIQTGPPPHAPAHGYRHNHGQGIQLQYDSGLSLYAVIGFPHIYFSNGLFYRYDSRSIWYTGTHHQGPWRAVTRKRVPPGLLKKYGKKHPGKKTKSKAW